MKSVIDGDSFFAGVSIHDCINKIKEISLKTDEILVLFIRDVELCNQLLRYQKWGGVKVKIQRLWSIEEKNDALDVVILEAYATGSLADLVLTNNNLLKTSLAERYPTSIDGSKSRNRSKTLSLNSLHEEKLKLAFLSPLPPNKSGIADYSAMLIPELSKLYDVEVFSDLENDFDYRSYHTFESVASEFDRIVYQIGNNPIHNDIYELMLKYPGVTVLHDFNLGDLIHFREAHDGKLKELTSTLIEQHGYKSLIENDWGQIFTRYPCSGEVFKSSLGTLLHSEVSVDKAVTYYSAESNVIQIPLVRREPKYLNSSFRKELVIPEDVMVVSTFGQVGEPKMHLDILDAWIEGDYLSNKGLLLCIVGGIPDNSYGASFKEKMSSIGENPNVRVTGFVNDDVYEQYLATTNIAIQLRTESRGETSAALLDCLNYGIPTIVNDNDSFEYANKSVAYILDAGVDAKEIVKSLGTLIKDKSLRKKLSKKSTKLIASMHRPEHCAALYMEAIENIYSRNISTTNSLVNKLKSTGVINGLLSHKVELAKAIALNELALQNTRTVYVDITAVHQTDLRTGIQRVVRALSREMLLDDTYAVNVKLVYLSDKAGYWEYYEASNFTKSLLGIEHEVLSDLPVLFGPNDILLMLDFTSDGIAEVFFESQHLYPKLEATGTKVLYVVYDLLPIRMPEFFPHGTAVHHHKWLEFVAQSDGVLCISEAVKNDFLSWVDEENIALNADFYAGSFPLGFDLINTNPSTGYPDGSEQILGEISENLSFLMVGTIEPRKGHVQVLQAFIELWNLGFDFRLVFVGKKGWLSEEGLSILEDAVQNYSEFIWLNGISDEFLEEVYNKSSCLISASEGEGYGLPLIEAASKGLPIIARDLPVFREVAQNCAYFFRNENGTDVIKSAILDWNDKYKSALHLSSKNIRLFTWSECKDILMEKILKV